jgi:nucleoside-diphosphate-sugar epimerase
MRTIALFGATGLVGNALLNRLLREGHGVRALVRDTSKLRLSHPNLTIIEGDILDFACVENCIMGSEAVYVCIGTWGNKPTQVYSMGTENTVLAMRKLGVQRIVCLSSAGIFGYDGGFFGRIIVPLTLWRPFRDKPKQARILADSELAWTLVRPTEIKLNKPAGRLRVSFHKPEKRSISLTTLIEYLCHVLQDVSSFKKMPILGD